MYLELVAGCGANYLAGEATIDYRKATPIKITDGDINGLWLQVPVELCGQQISGRLANAVGQPLADTWVGACLEIDGDCVWAWGRTDGDGAFAITVPAEGKYHVQFSLDGCTVYFSSGSLTTTYGEHSTVRVEERGVRLSSRQILADMCAHRISGHFVHANGAPLSGEWLNVCNAGECRGFRADENGEFVIRVPADGSYNFLAKPQSEPPCWQHLDGEVPGSPNNPIRVSGADVTDIILRLPGTVEELCE